jgi:hypothetical protein
MKTAPIKAFVEEVLQTVPSPYGEDLINDVFVAIENNSQWLQRYEELCDEFTKDVVNQFGGFWIGRAVGRAGVRQVDSKCSLIGSYSKLE